MFLTKLIEADKKYRNIGNINFDQVSFTNELLSLVTKVRSFTVVCCDDDIIEATVNGRHVYKYNLKRGRSVVRSCLARIANIYHENYNAEFEPYVNSFTIPLPLGAWPESQLEYRITFVNTSVKQAIEFKRLP